MIRVLQVVESLNVGGIQSFLLNLYRNIDRSKIQFDFLIFREEPQFYEEEIKKLGGHIFRLPARHTNPLKYRKNIRSFLKKHVKEYVAFHYHTSSLSNIIPVQEAKRSGLQLVIIHSHNTAASGNRIHTYLHKFNKKFIHRYVDACFACGEMAGKWMYDGTKCSGVKIVYNGIDIDSFKFDEEIRKKTRNALNISEDKIIVGHVGRFSQAKNQEFIVQLCKKIKTMSKKYIFLLIGDGPEKPRIEKLISDAELDNEVILLGNRKDVNELSQAMDIFILPSLFEGFPVTAIEAQAVGLPCILSTNISPECSIKSNVIMLKIDDAIDLWADELLAKHERIEDNKVLISSGFNIHNTVNLLSSIYNGG